MVFQACWVTAGNTQAGVGTQSSSETTSEVTGFTDDPLVPGVTPIRAVHFRELRTRIDALRMQTGLPAFAWTDPTLTLGVTPVRHVHLTDMREALAAAYEAAGRPVPAYGARVAAGTPIRASDVTELRIDSDRARGCGSNFGESVGVAEPRG